MQGVYVWCIYAFTIFVSIFLPDKTDFAPQLDDNSILMFSISKTCAFREMIGVC